MVDVQIMKTAAELRLAEAFAAAKASLPGDPAVAARREDAFRQFDARGLPHRRVEEWKYTDLRAAMREARPLAAPPDAAALEAARGAGQLLAAAGTRRLTFVNGSFVPALSELSGLELGLAITPMAAALAAGDPAVVGRLGRVVPTDDVAVALNTAFMGDGAVITVAAGTTVERPLHLVFVTAGDTPAAIFARSLVVVGAGARVTLVESYEGPGEIDYQVNAALELEIGDDAVVDHVKIGGDGTQALHVATLMAAIGARAWLRDFSFLAGGAVVRNQLFVRFAGEDARASLGGANLLKGRQHADTTMVVDHALPGGTSRELFKSVLDADSRAVFQGKIIVRPGAQKTDGKMMTRALLLSDSAEADSKPELEIFADDVQCGHGATVGALDEELLFYLRARGIPQAEAEALLIEAFVGEAIEAVEHEGVREALAAVAAQWLRQRR
jgi:Fe-S cluster assembly protein SufD